MNLKKNRLKYQPIAKMRKYCVCSAILTKNIMRKFFILMVFRQFLSEFSILLKPVFSAEIPIKVTDYYAYNSFPSVASIQLMMIEAKMGPNGRRLVTFFFILLTNSPFSSMSPPPLPPSNNHLTNIILYLLLLYKASIKRME